MGHAFCTVTVGGFGVAQALLLARSLAAVRPGARLHVVVVGEPGPGLLEALAAGDVEGVTVEQLEEDDPGLAALRPVRGASAYGWTAKASLCLRVLARTGADTVTFLDADQRFYADPGAVLDGELAEAATGLLPHRHRPEHHRRDAWAGRFNAGWVTFRRDDDGLAALRHWRERSLEWCENRVEPGRYGDQAYLEELPRRFARVHTIGHPGAARAPWSDQSTLSPGPDGPEIEGRPLISFHFQSLRLRLSPRTRRPVWHVYRGHRLSDVELDVLWRPYVRELAGALTEVADAGAGELVRLTGLTPRDVLAEWRQHVWMVAKDRGWR